MVKGSPTKARVEYIDVAKAVAILAVIAGHTAIRFVGVGRGASLMFATCFTFHLPLFFIVSGFFMKPERAFQWRREAFSLVLPYAFTAAAVVVGICVSNYLLRDWGSTRQLLREWSSAALYAAGDIPRNPLWPQTQRIGAIWFLFALFWARLFVTLAHRTPAPWAVIGVFFVAGYWSSKIVFLPLDLQSGMCAASFVYFGVLARKYDVLEQCARMPLIWLGIAAIWIWAILRYQGFGMAMCDYGPTPVWFVRNVAGGIAGAACVIGLCAALERFVSSWAIWRLLCSLGTVTLPIMCVHLFEDDVVRWGWIIDFTARAFGPMSLVWLIVLAARIILDVAIARLLARTPVVSGFLGLRRKAALSGSASTQRHVTDEEADAVSTWHGFGWEGKLLLVLVIACVTLVTVQALVLTADIDMTAGAGIDVMHLNGLVTGDVVAIVISIVACVFLCAVVAGLTWILRRSNPDAVFCFCVILTLIIQFLWIRCLNTHEYMYIDSRSLDTLAKDYLNGTFAEYRTPKLSLAPYLEFYPFQANSTWSLIAAYSLFGYGNQMAFLALNAIANCMTSAALYLLLRHAYSRHQTVLICYSVIITFCIPLWFSCVFLYPNCIGLAFSVWGLLASVRALDAADKGERLAGIIWSFFLLTIGCFFKSTNTLFVLGVIVLWVVYSLRSRRYWEALPVLLCALMTFSVTELGVGALERISGCEFGRGMPRSTWITMGINNKEVQLSRSIPEGMTPEDVAAPYEGREGFRIVAIEEAADKTGSRIVTIGYRAVPGWWREDMYDEFFATNNDYDQQNIAQINHIRNLLAGYIAEPNSALVFFGTKLATEWTNPDFMSLYYSALGDNDLGGVENNLLYQSYPTSRLFRIILDGYQSLVYCLSLATLVYLLASKLRLSAAPSGLCICFLVGFLCFVLWEAKSAYVVSYFLLLIPLAAMALGTIVNRVELTRERLLLGDGGGEEQMIIHD